LEYVEATSGLFHLSVQALAMLFDTHLGTIGDQYSISRWMTDLRRDNRVIWSVDKTNVKDFRACLDLFDTILDGYIMADLATRSGFSSIPDFMSGLETMEPKVADTAVRQLSEHLCDFMLASTMRSEGPDHRDTLYENRLIFMQQGMVLRNLSLAMRHGDSGMVTACLAYFTVWFQATRKHNYAFETIHLTACIKKLWSPDFLKFWMDNCLINPSGRREGWMACDYLGEYVVREIKSMMHNNVNQATSEFLWNTISPLILSFRNVRKVMEHECDVPYSTMHSTKVTSVRDVESVAKRVLDNGVCHFRPGDEPVQDKPVPDLHGTGISILSDLESIKKYIAKVEKDHGIVHETMDTRNEVSEGIDFEVDEDAAATLLEGSEDECLDGRVLGSHEESEPED
jgi:hypothetical protein